MNFENHPCFNPGACKDYGRVHLPVAPRCNIQCNFCNRKFDCVNESRPGVSSSILTPVQAMAWLDRIMAAKKNIAVVGIAGPGDPFANPDQTLETFDRVSVKYPDTILCLASNGLNLPPYLDDIAKLNISHVTITVNAVDPKISQQIYAWVRSGKKTLSPEKGAQILLEKQLESIQGLKERGMVVKVNTIILPGINDRHTTDIARKMAEFDVDLLNLIPYYPNEGSNFALMKEPDKATVEKRRSAAQQFIPQMRHCRRCRADAVGLLEESTLDTDISAALRACAAIKDETPTRVALPGTPSHYIAVATREGVLVNQHLGAADSLCIYDISQAVPALIDRRRLPEAGDGPLRWKKLCALIKDCSTLLASGIGDAPGKVLAENGIQTLVINGLIQEILDGIKHGHDINHLMAPPPSQCGRECTGTGMGCM